jgi:hypothetical protein
MMHYSCLLGWLHGQLTWQHRIVAKKYEYHTEVAGGKRPSDSKENATGAKLAKKAKPTPAAKPANVKGMKRMTDFFKKKT